MSSYILAAFVAVTENRENDFEQLLKLFENTYSVDDEYSFQIFKEELAANNTSGAEVSNPNAVNIKKKMSALLKRKGFKELK